MPPRLTGLLHNAAYTLVSVPGLLVAASMARNRRTGLIGLGAALGLGPPSPAAIVPLVVAAVVITFLGVLAVVVRRRRFPTGVAVVGLAVLALTSSPVPLMLALYALAIRRRDTRLWGLGLAGLISTIALVLVPAGETLVNAALNAGLLIGMPVAAGAYVGARRDLLVSLRERAEQAEGQLVLRTVQARMTERSRIAREMHDVVAHRISLVAVHAGALQVRPDSEPEQVERAAELIRDTAHQALEDLRGVLAVLRSDEGSSGAELSPQPRLADLPVLVAESARAGLPVRLDRAPGLDPGTVELPELIGRTVIRVVQEALTNVHKHARNAATVVSVTGSPGRRLRVQVVNVRPVGGGAGPGAAIPGAGLGLVGLRERVVLAGGVLDAGPTPDGGWRLSAEFGWPA